MKPYRRHPIEECGEILLSLEHRGFVLTDPHPYQAFGAPYGSNSPWMARAAVVQALEEAHASLQAIRPEWRFRIFDAYRPNSVQAYMVGHEFRSLSGGRHPKDIPETEAALIWEKTYRIWAEPSDDPWTPPPHATGAALDLTLIDADGRDVPMGSPIDENSERSLPHYFRDLDPLIHANRQLLHDIMTAAGFERHSEEWWHFCLGDQMWAWMGEQRDSSTRRIARYGRWDLIAP